MSIIPQKSIENGKKLHKMSGTKLKQKKKYDCNYVNIHMYENLQ